MKKTAITTLALIIALESAFAVMAYMGQGNGMYYDEDRHTAVESAIESGDYDTWYALMTEDGRQPHMVDFVTEDNFATFAEMHEAMEDGDLVAAQAARAELGVVGRGFGGMHGGQQRAGDCPMWS